MSLHYLLDGYNILKQMSPLRDLPLEEGRKGLLRWINISRPHGSENNKVTVVFDGKPDQFAMFPGTQSIEHQSQQDVRIIFSDGCSADDKIKAMVEEDQDKKNCVVVTDDKDIYLYARSLGAQIMKVEAFTSIRAPRAASKRGKGSAEKYISLSSQEKINKELGSLWLKDKK